MHRSSKFFEEINKMSSLPYSPKYISGFFTVQEYTDKLEVPWRKSR